MTDVFPLKMIIMRGISGSGKSTVVENIVKENKLNYINHVFSADNFFIPKTLDFLYKEKKTISGMIYHKYGINPPIIP